MNNQYLGIDKENRVIVTGYGEKITFTKGRGKYKRKKQIIVKPDESRNEIIEKISEDGWQLASITPHRMR